MIGLLVTGSHSFASETTLQTPPRGFWRRVADWLMGR
jgi:hypothetical protein